MKRLLILVAAGLILVPGGQAAKKPDKETQVKRDLKKLKGTWQVVAIERNGGEKAEEGFTKSCTLVFKGDKLTMNIGKDSNTYTIKLDPTKKPKEMDMITDGKPSPAIYSLEKLPNADTETVLKLVIDAAHKTRAKEFRTKQGATFMLLTLRKRN